MTEEKKRPKLVLVDGSNYLFRAFYAIRELSNSKGFPTNAIYGFTTMLMKLLRDQAPDYVAVAFDVKAPTFRHEAFADYKATRRAIPDTLIPQIPYVKEIVRGFAIPIIEQPGLEADDIIGTIARKQAQEGMDVVVVSGDKDLMQLVSGNVVMVDTMKDKTYDVAAVTERFGVGPDKVVEILGLMGDVSDNIPGVRGIGPKGALRLIEQFGGVREILDHPEKIHNLKIREAILANADQARLSRELAQIRTDAVFAFDLEACRRREPDRELLISLFREFEFSSLLQELKSRGEKTVGEYCIVRTQDELASLVARLGDVGEFSIELVLSSSEAMRASLVGLAVSPLPGEGFYIPITHEGGDPQLSVGTVLKALGPFLTGPGVRKHGHDLKTAIIVLSESGVSPRGLGCDTMVASYLLNPTKHSFELADTVLDHLGRQVSSAKEVIGSGMKAVPFASLSVEKAKDYACPRAGAVMDLVTELSGKIVALDMKALLDAIEMPLVAVLAAMEKKGGPPGSHTFPVPVGGDGAALALSEEKIIRLAGEKFNINSPKQLQVVLFDKTGSAPGTRRRRMAILRMWRSLPIWRRAMNCRRRYWLTAVWPS